MATISDLRQVAHFKAAIADRIWREWWVQQGSPYEEIESRVGESLGADRIPLCLVAHDGDTFIGTASVVGNDFKTRPQYTPWVAAVFVEPLFRGGGHGARLVQAATRAGFEAGASPIYLCASPANSPFYEKLGWARLETDVNGLNIFEMHQ